MKQLKNKTEKQRVNLYLEPVLSEQLNQKAEEEYIPISVLIKQILKRDLAERNNILLTIKQDEK